LGLRLFVPASPDSAAAPCNVKIEPIPKTTLPVNAAAVRRLVTEFILFFGTFIFVLKGSLAADVPTALRHPKALRGSRL